MGLAALGPRLHDLVLAEAHAAAATARELEAPEGLVAQAREPMHVTVLGSGRFNDYTDGGRELFDRRTGRIRSIY